MEERSQHGELLARPRFLLTLDTELIWGSFHHMSVARFGEAYPDIRGTIERTLGLLEQYEIAATWAVVGHLYLDECHRDAGGAAHPEIPHPKQSWWPRDWFALDPCTDRIRDPLWYGPDVLDLLQGARVAQEIGCHSFSHALYGDPTMSRQAVDADLAACVALAKRRGLTLRSFVFPQNSEGHHEALRAAGFTAFRGADPTAFATYPRAAARGARLLTHAIGSVPPVSRPSERLPGLWDLPGSSLFMHRAGARRIITRRARIRRAMSGLRRAQREGGIFHLWTHPFNLADDPSFLLGVLDEILRAAVAARDAGVLDIETMGSLTDRLVGADGS
jgi:peptidoglycan/xylan/chitin deacetylase (PgdA/CDA1 family)